MLRQITRLNSWHKAELLEQAEITLECWNEQGQPEIVGNACHLHNHDGTDQYDTVLVLYRCTCGEYIADFDDYSGRDIDSDRCYKCNRPYDYTEKELAEL